MSNFIERLEKTAQERGVSFFRVERDLQLGNGTIKRWAEQSPRLDKLVSVAKYLNVSLDYLVFGTLHPESSPSGDGEPDLERVKREQGLACDGLPLDEAEVDLVAMFRLLPPSHQEEVFDLVYFKYKRHVEQKKESIFSTCSRGSGTQKSDPRRRP